MKSLIILPTYNEKDNLPEVVRKILALDNNMGIVIVDDNSPDGTGRLADTLSGRNPDRIKIIHRQGERGRGLAGIEGFKYAVSQNADYIFEMDADLSHRPEEIPIFWQKIVHYDVVIGSRYIQGGAQPDRSLIRRAVSCLARIYLRLILGVNVHDPTSGFRCFRKEALQRINLDTLVSKGPEIVEEILYRCSKKKCRISEVPIIFEKRYSGKSKLNLTILLKCLILPLLIKIKRKERH